MADVKVNKISEEIPKSGRIGRLKLIDPAVSNFFAQLPRKIQTSVESQLKKYKKYDGRTNIEVSEQRGLSSVVDLNAMLDKQMQAWKENPVWSDQPPQIEVSVPKGSLCNLSVKVDFGLPPDAVYNIVTDPDNKRIFKNIKEVVSRKVLIDEGSRQVVDLEQAAIWRFLWWSGTIAVHVLVDQNRADHSMKFKQVKAGFMEKFEGSWKVEPLFVDEKVCYPVRPKTLAEYESCSKGKGRIGSRVTLQQLIQPSMVPPPPISWYLRGITTRTTEMLINDMIAEAARLRGAIDEVTSNQEVKETKLESDQLQTEVNESMDIKKRWALQRRNSKTRT
uniref:DUF220 domain-containing protein n=1 Tax=Kalanchoe fedtschenkoi TaxID=63787 RepID=A0A7N0ZTN6_KALFE